MRAVFLGTPDVAVPSLDALSRIGDVADIANAYVWLASDAATWVTGTTLSVDGGLVIGT